VEEVGVAAEADNMEDVSVRGIAMQIFTSKPSISELNQPQVQLSSQIRQLSKRKLHIPCSPPSLAPTFGEQFSQTES
jgi:hypothetical protein